MNLTDVETLGATSAINTDKTGTLTMNQMMVSTIYSGGSWFTVEGAGYRKSGAILSVAGTPVPDFSRLALGLVLDSDATVAEDGSVVGDPTEAALVVLSAKLGVDAEETRRAHPRIAEVPFDSEYTFMATFHHVPDDPTGQIIELVKGGPDVVLARCTMSGGPLSGSQVPIEQVCGSIVAANAGMGEKGLRVLAFAARLVDDDETWAMTDDPMSLTHELALVGVVGIIDPLQAEAKAAVQTALHAGIDVRMITGDHAVTAKAIGETLGLGPGAISGSQLQAMSDGTAVLFWILYGAVLFVAALVPFVAGPDAPSVNRPSASLTMTFVVMGLGTVFNALTNRRDPTSGLTAPILQALAISLAPSQ
jgi:Ca2+-transporting ATPase